MKVLLKIIAILTSLAALIILAVILLTPWMNRWGATDDEVTAALAGDEYVNNPKEVVTRAITIMAPPESIFPWLLQIGADKGGYYSYSWLEAMLFCRIVNADRIHPEWQDLQVGDLVKMCPGDYGPPPYQVAVIIPNQAVVLGHQENGKWVENWQFVLVPDVDGSTRLIVRTRTMMTGGLWSIIHPGVFIMETGMMKGIKERSEGTNLVGQASGKSDESRLAIDSALETISFTSNLRISAANPTRILDSFTFID